MQDTRANRATCPATGVKTKQHAAAVCKRLHTGVCVLFMVDQLTELGGAERSLFQLADELEHRGVRVIIVTFRDHPDPKVLALHNRIIILPMKSCLSIRGLRVAIELSKTIRHERVDIVQTYFETSDIFGALVARIAGVTRIVSSRRDMGFLRGTRHRVAYRLLAPLYSAVVTVSEQVHQWHRRSDRLPQSKVRTIHNGISLLRFDKTVDVAAVRRKLHLPANVPLITTISNINAWKGLDVFLSTAAVVRAQYPQATFCIAGDWTDVDLVSDLRKQAESLGLTSCTHFLGRIDEVDDLLVASDVFVLLSRSEGLPNVVLEAMGAGVPVVATAVGGTPEVLTNGVNGFLVKNGDAATAATHIGALLSDIVLVKRIRAAARATLASDFSMEKMIDKHIDLYKSLMGNRF